MSDSDEFELPTTKNAIKKKTKRTPLQQQFPPENDENKPTIEQIYQKKTQLEHILLRPDTYIGSVEEVTQPMWVFDDASSRIVQREITFVPGLYKIFDEILVNAADNKQRDDSMTILKVNIDEQQGKISVWNNGKGIPIVKHSEHGVYVPELIFGHLLTGSNFNDKKKKTTGGRNGYGAKLANIFSTEFIIETASKSEGLKYKQVFTQNMGKREKPVITKSSGSEFTCVTFTPDFDRFKTHLTKDMVSLFMKRVYDIAGVCTGKLRVELNGIKLPVKSFEQYVKMYETAQDSIVFDTPDDRWQVAVGVSDDGFQQVSFVNSICTHKGGQHVSHILDQVVSKLVSIVKKKNKGEAVKPAYIKNHITIYVSALIENPAFDSQTKELLTSRQNTFGSSHTVSDKFLKAVEKSGVVNRILQYAKFKQTAELRRKGGSKQKKLTGITKLDDANFAGSAKGKNCTLILTEGDSAKSLAVSGLSVVGRNYYGVFPLRGKLLNVREASHSQIMKNEEIQNLVKILGLKFGEKYESSKSLRYGHIMIMTDQDHDGSHIKGLVINFLHHFWPSLLELPGFLQEFITPIVKANKGNNTNVFYTIPEYQVWKESAGDLSGWRIKYYKGLGTSTAKEAKEYFSDLKKHEIKFEYNNEDDGDAIDMAFSKKRVADRKTWLLDYIPGGHVDYDVDAMPYQEFVNKELILFSIADNTRSIPCVLDGFKPSQRKVLFSCFKRKLKNEIKVAQLAGYVSEHSAYHHGEASLNGTIINMAQDYVGSNNINLLTPSGQFGTRLMGGKDAASPRYVFTKLESVTRLLFPVLDDPILEYLEDDGQYIEPTWYLPVIPMALINGSDGIGTGWSCSIPNYNPIDVINILRSKLHGEPTKPMAPWYRGFQGTIEAKSDASVAFITSGIYEQIDDCKIRVTELPIKTWTQQYKHFLEGLLEDGTIKDFQENHTDTKVLFTITFDSDKLLSIQNDRNGGLMKKLKLESSITTSNMHLYDQDGRIRKYESPLDILDDFYPVRLEFYGKRKAFMLEKLRHEKMILKNKVRFINGVINSEVMIHNETKQRILDQLIEQKYDSVSEKVQDDGGVPAGGFDYLLSMKLWALSKERIEKLEAELVQKEREYDELQRKSPQDLWETDLTALESYLRDFSNIEEGAPVSVSTRPVPQKKSRAVAKTSKSVAAKSKKKSIPKKSEEKDEEEEEEVLSLTERLAKRMHLSNTDGDVEDDVFATGALRERANEIASKLTSKPSIEKDKKKPNKAPLKRRKDKTPMKPKKGPTVIESPWKVSPDKKKQCVKTSPPARRPKRDSHKSVIYLVDSEDEEDVESDFDLEESESEDDDFED